MNKLRNYAHILCLFNLLVLAIHDLLLSHLLPADMNGDGWTASANCKARKFNVQPRILGIQRALNKRELLSFLLLAHG